MGVKFVYVMCALVGVYMGYLGGVVVVVAVWAVAVVMWLIAVL